MSNKGDCRTAPVIPGLLNIYEEDEFNLIGTQLITEQSQALSLFTKYSLDISQFPGDPRHPVQHGSPQRPRQSSNKS